MLFRTRTLLTGLAGTVALATVLSGCGALPGSQPGGTRVVASSWVMMAGPLHEPAPSVLRASTGVSHVPPAK